MHILKIRKHFSAAHYLREYKGRCEEIHGHNYLIEVEVVVERLPKKGFCYDFKEIERYLDKILPDHKNLNEVFDFNPTAENLAFWIYQKVQERYPIRACEVWENEKFGARYEFSDKE